MIIVTRLILTFFLLLNMWLGRPWALYLAVTLLTVNAELCNWAVGSLYKVLAAMRAALREPQQP